MSTGAASAPHTPSTAPWIAGATRGAEARDGKVQSAAPAERPWRCERRRNGLHGPRSAPAEYSRPSTHRRGAQGVGTLRALFLCAATLSAVPGGVVVAQCPNACSGHGTCGTGSVCNCFSGWEYAADCSERTCSNGPAWADKAYAADTAHSMVECSNAGMCDRSTGLCACFDGYSGAACTRSLCPNECSGNGQCMTIGDMGQFEGKDYDQPGIGGDGVGPVYSNWDKASTTACVCYAGFFGPDCSSIMCPKDDDPVSINQESIRCAACLREAHHTKDAMPIRNSTAPYATLATEARASVYARESM